MQVYVVSYQLRKTDKNYSGFFEELQRSASWWHYLDSTWLIATTETATDLYNRLRGHLDAGDSILVVQAGADVQGWLPAEAWQWIQGELLGWR